MQIVLLLLETKPFSVGNWHPEHFEGLEHNRHKSFESEHIIHEVPS
jgi:hypothetical protein